MAALDKEKIEKVKVASTDIWLSVSECAKIGGVQAKTIRRALQKDLRFKIVKDRYFIKFPSLIKYLNHSIKLKNKLNEHGLGQYVKEWKL
jgi:hypothetical protein